MPSDAELAVTFPVEGDPATLEAFVVDQREVLRELEGAGDEETDRARGVALWRLGDALFRLRRVSDAVECLEKAERAFAQLAGCDLLAVHARLMLAGALVVLERYERAAELAVELRAYGGSIHDSRLTHRAGYIAAVAFQGAGRWQDATVAAADYLAGVGDDQPAGERARAMVIQAIGERRYGRPDTAVALLDRAFPIIATDGDREDLFRLMGLRAASLYSAGRPDEARAAYKQIIDEFSDATGELRIGALWGARAMRLRIRMLPHRPPRPHKQRDG